MDEDKNEDFFSELNIIDKEIQSDHRTVLNVSQGQFLTRGWH